jgi:hypothetical protein
MVSLYVHVLYARMRRGKGRQQFVSRSRGRGKGRQQSGSMNSWPLELELGLWPVGMYPLDRAVSHYTIMH